MPLHNVEPPEVLLVENSLDDEMVWFKGILNSKIRCRVTVRRNGEEALDYLLGPSEPLPALIVLDNRMPKVEGLEILTRLRLENGTRSIPVVLFNGTNAGCEKTECFRIGADSCITRPAHRREYIERLARITRYWLTVSLAP